MKRFWFGVCALGTTILAMVLAGCGPGGLFEDSSAKATREAQNVVYEETIHAVQTQASTLVSLQATAESASSMATQIVRVSAQNRALEATLDSLALGIPFASSLAPQPPAAAPDGQAPAITNQTLPNANPPTPTFAPVAIGGNYLDATTALAVSDDDGCALDRTASFTPDTPQIYMVVRAQNIQAGTTFYTRWLLNNQNRFETVSWTPEEGFPEICIWFYVTPQDMVFLGGAWSVQLIANESPVITANFQIEAGGGFNPVATEDQ